MPVAVASVLAVVATAIAMAAMVAMVVFVVATAIAKVAMVAFPFAFSSAWLTNHG